MVLALAKKTKKEIIKNVKFEEYINKITYDGIISGIKRYLEVKK